MAVHRDGKEYARGLRVLSGGAPSPHVAPSPSALKRQPEQRHRWLCSYGRHIIPPLPRQRDLSWAELGHTQADLDMQGDTPASRGCRLSCERAAVVTCVLGAPGSNQP